MELDCGRRLGSVTVKQFEDTWQVFVREHDGDVRSYVFDEEAHADSFAAGQRIRLGRAAAPAATIVPPADV